MVIRWLSLIFGSYNRRRVRVHVARDGGANWTPCPWQKYAPGPRGWRDLWCNSAVSRAEQSWHEEEEEAAGSRGEGRGRQRGSRVRYCCAWRGAHTAPHAVTADAALALLLQGQEAGPDAGSGIMGRHVTAPCAGKYRAATRHKGIRGAIPFGPWLFEGGSTTSCAWSSTHTSAPFLPFSATQRAWGRGGPAGSEERLRGGWVRTAFL